MNPPAQPALLDDLRRALAGRYDVESLLGEGGMGSVFRGRDVTLDRPVAIKVIAPELASSPAVRERFLQEARTVARLRHPNVVAVYAAGEAEGTLYFVMEHVDGESLRARLERDGRLDGPAGTRVLCELARALHYAHEHGVVHRDVKPENVLLDAESGTAMLTDFGIARALSPRDGRLTGTGMLVGSPSYMSPEQVGGDGTLDGRSDVYSLGLVGYEMFAGAPAVDGTPSQQLVKQLTETPPPVETRAPDVPPGVARAIDRALAKDPAARWPSAAAMADAIDGSAAATLPGVVRPPAAPSARRGRLRRRLALLTAVVVAAAASGAWWLNRTAGGVPRGVDARHSYLVAPFEVLTGDPQLAWLREGSVSMLSMNLAQWTDLTVVDYEHSLDLLREAKLDGTRPVALEDARRMARHAGVWTVVMGQVTSTPDSLLVVARLFDVASGRRVDEAQRAAARGADPRPLFDALSRDLLDLAGAPSGVTLGTLAATTTTSVGAYRDYLAGSHALNMWDIARADSLFRRATDADSTFALAYYKRALAMGWSNSGDTAQLTTIARANAYAGRLPARDRDVIGAYADLIGGLVAQQGGDTKRADALLVSAQRRYAAIVERDSGAADAWYGLGDAFWHHHPGEGQGSREMLGNWTPALRAFDRTLALDSSFHLAYSHKLDIYRAVSGTTAPAILDGDSIRPLLTDAERRAAGPDLIARARATARGRAVAEAEAWLATDPVPQAYQALVEAHAGAGHLDSAAAVTAAATARLGDRAIVLPFDLATLQLAADPVAASATLRSALDRFGTPPEGARLPASGSGVVLQSASAAAMAGRPGDMERVARLFARMAPSSPVPGVDSRMIGLWWVKAAELAMGAPTPASRSFVDSGIAGIERLPEPVGARIRMQLAAVPYAAYVGTHDPRYLRALRRWVDPSRPPMTELDALAAIAAGDTAAAAAAARGFPSIDSISAAGGVLPPTRWVVRAEVLASLGDLRGAVHVYERLDPARFGQFGMVDPGWPLYARSFLARGQLHEQLGDRRAAAAAYARFIALWKDADPALQPQVRLARAGLARVQDAPGTIAVPMGKARD